MSTLLHPPSSNCAEFKQQVIAHYSGSNKLHNDAGKAHELYQTSIMSALMQGVYEGKVTFGQLSEHGDFGLGTFNDLDGEMVGFDGRFYQLRADGSAHPVEPAQKTPFATVNFFRDGIVEGVHRPLSKQDFPDLVHHLVKTDNLFFAIRVDGWFASVRTRTVSIQAPPFRKLTEVTSEQKEFEFRDVRGTLAGYRSPDYAQGLTVAGYHLHFLTDDKAGGGHVLDFMLRDGVIRIDPYSSLFVALPETPEFETARLGIDNEDIEKAEG
ncbi:MAG TPA: acetolactate decarboxylase [Puia sp.]|jgi:acetolactate decarboxylase|nr:acetolactate decarboxylase [Puia sp.]